MSTSTRITRSKGKSDGLSLPMRTRPTRRDTALGRNRGMVLSTPGQEQQQQMPTQTPHLTQLPEAASAERTTTAPMLPPGPHRPLTPSMPLPTSPTSSPHSSASLFKDDRYSSTSEEESEMDEVTFTHSKTNGTFSDCHAKRPTSTPTPSDYTTQGDPDGHEDEIEINKAHVRNPNYKGKNYNPNFTQNRLKATNNNTNMSKNQNNNTSSLRTIWST